MYNIIFFHIKLSRGWVYGFMHKTFKMLALIRTITVCLLPNQKAPCFSSWISELQLKHYPSSSLIWHLSAIITESLATSKLKLTISKTKQKKKKLQFAGFLFFFVMPCIQATTEPLRGTWIWHQSGCQRPFFTHDAPFLSYSWMTTCGSPENSEG